MKIKNLFSAVIALAISAFSLFAGDIDNSAGQFLTNLTDLRSDVGTWTINANGLTGSNISGDAFVLSNTTAGENFVYECDVTFNNGNESAASLVFGSTNNLGSKNMYVANIHVHNGVARIFKFQTGNRGQEALDLMRQRTIPIPADRKFHLSVTVIGKHIVYSINGVVVLNTADYTMTIGGGNEIYGQNDAFTGHYLGLLSWKANCTYQNLNVTPITDASNPTLTNLSLTGSGIEHNVVFNPKQYVSITYVDNTTTSVGVDYTKFSAATAVELSSKNTVITNNSIPLEVGANYATLTCTNGNAKVLYRLVIIRRKAADLYYKEFDRPQFHWSVKQGWTNDPNGMVFYNGQWHLFHQFYYGINWNSMHWGHSVSNDLLHWQDLPVALYPDEYGTMYSGSAVVDENNTSGLFKEADGITPSATGGLVAIPTADGNGERVCIAYSRDGIHWDKHEGVVIDWTEDPINNRDFRDPKVFRYQDKWFLVIAGGPVRFYSSNNLIDWTVESVYDNIHTECPDFFPIDVEENGDTVRKWVLSRGGRGYKVGSFAPDNSGKWKFTPDNTYSSSDGNMNFGNDAYAEQTYYVGNFDVPQRLINIQWMNFRAPNIGIDNGNRMFNGQMTLQNELSLTKNPAGKYLLQQTPIDEYKNLRDSVNKVVLTNQSVQGTKKLDFAGQSYEIVAEFDLTNATEVGFNVRTGNGYYTKVGYNRIGKQFYIDRTKTGIGGYRDKFTQNSTLDFPDGKVKMHIFVDRNTVEFYAADYTVTGAAFIYPAFECDSLSIFSTGVASVANVEIFPLKSIWNNTAQPTQDPKNYTHLIMYGQSLSTGHEAGTPLSAENIAGNYMLGQQVWYNYGNYDLNEINPLVGHPSFVMGGDLFEPAIMGAANSLRTQNLVNNIIASSTGDSGKSIEDLSKESQVQRLYGVYTQALHSGKQAVERTGSTIYCPAIFWLQGEWNYTQEGDGLTSSTRPNNTKNGYKNLLMTLKNNMQNDAQRIYGQTEKPLFITYQTGGMYVRGRTVNIGMAQMEIANENDDVICAGPCYQMTNYSHGHLDANGYRWYGEMLAKVYNKVKLQGENFMPLQPKNLRRDTENARKVIIQFHVPEPPLVLDTKTMPQITNYGFLLYANRTAQTITNVQVLGQDCVEITCSNEIPLEHDIEITYAGENAVGQGNLRDSDPYLAAFNYVNIDQKDGSGNYIYPRSNNRSLRPAYEPKNENGQVIYNQPYPLYNFCVGFYYLLPKNTDRLDILSSVSAVQKNDLRIFVEGKTLRVLSDDGTRSPRAVKIYDLFGKLVKDFGTQTSNEFYLNPLNTGIYIVSVSTENATRHQKIVL